MSLAGALEALMTETVTIEPFLSTTVGGSSIYSAATTVKARIQQGARLVRDRQNREVVSNTRLYLAPTATDGTSFTPGDNDRVTLPASYSPRQPPIIFVGRKNDEHGLHHWMLDL